MLHRTAPFRSSPDEITKAELDSIGLGDPAAALRRETMRDLRILVIVFLVAFLFASYLDIGDWYRETAVKYEHWEFDEIAVAIILSAIAFCSFPGASGSGTRQK